VVAEHCPRTFFSVQRFYTTAANRMARQQLPQAVLTEDIIAACGGLTVSADLACPDEDIRRLFAVTGSNGGDAAPDSASKNQRGKIKPWRILLGILMAALFVFLSVYGYGRWTEDWRLYASQALIGLALVLALWAFIPGKLLSSWNLSLPPSLPVEKRQLSKRTLAALLMIVAVIPLTIYVGYYFFADRKYYFISLLIILETMLPFLMVFEGRKPQAREMVVIAVLVGIAVAGRAACFMIPSFKPVLALVIIAGICFGGEVGFLVGALTGFVSNFFFGQGPWTPWQMLGFGMVGFAAGILFCKGLLRKQRGSLCIFGGLAAMVIYGPLMDTATVLMYQANPTWPMILAAYGLGLPFNIVHAVATMMFLWLIAGSMIEKLERIKHKYGLLG
ncbi:MAG: ECF transporter S component, partial [Clostridiales bacterium]